ncbi:hypothetical protein CNMCM8927_006631 [Aspergillus lentulus]|uniref:C2H2-type domain-containing protein n=1 Tax=Aspergillus lentulus TaxID=293939 RepID=A0AAN6BQB3_ASPLE|nr:hypothetical protein CNMCM8060_004020 [Aspergillus lentulus]KAF4185124.1 hypothetical protein CNMCM7927_007031 [Aspergillus lentulus]KAF4193113.1 hypothetical protein CNMCM8694_009322 [Aspergillus lentulus]KAF4204991.1 hypothetical protein CNMCM8927_006631 [Aspergillus lentulus]
MTDAYEPDDDRLTPGLEVQKPNYKPDEQLPPFLTQDSLSKSGATAKYPGDEGTSSDFPRKPSPTSKPETTEGDSVLISHLDPNRPDIANYELEHRRVRDPWVEDQPSLQKTKIDPQAREDGKFQEPASSVAERALQLLSSVPDVLPPPENLVSPRGLKSASSPQSIKDLLEPPVPQAEPISIKVEVSSPKESHPPGPPNFTAERKSPVVSPLKKFAISPSEGPVQALLPALQTSPPLAIAKSPENHQQHSLPSIQTALAEISGPYSLPPVSTSPPSIPRNEPAWDHQRPGQFAPPQVPPSPYSHLSPASSKGMSAMSSPASQQQSQWRHTQSNITYLTTPHYEPSPSAVKSPATSYPTPTDQTPTGERAPFNPGPPPTAPVPPGTFKCRHPGCTAPPFQTQYLLNSHANVHSQDRPHFCPVEGCARGVGGKGFKRKNEMIRHGLVHNSPGHVRVHHVDKSKDDPELRRVLSQRPEGSTRGRRRRTTAQ